MNCKNEMRKLISKKMICGQQALNLRKINRICVSSSLAILLCMMPLLLSSCGSKSVEGAGNTRLTEVNTVEIIKDTQSANIASGESTDSKISRDTELTENTDTGNKTAASEAIDSEIISEKSFPTPKTLGKLHWKSELSLHYAKEFSVNYYEDNAGRSYKLLETRDGKYLLSDGNAAVREAFSEKGALLTREELGLPEELVILPKADSGIYLAASAAMDMFRALDGIHSLQFSSLKKEDWKIPEAVDAMEAGSLVYAGKYSAPDFELLLSEGCNLAIENSMIFHSPEILEKIESLGIPVLLEYSSFEEHPLGRVEWVKFFGALLSKEELAEEVFSEQERAMQAASKGEPSGKTVAYFYLTGNGAVNVRKSGDYIPKMIELAGGKYIFENLGRDGSRSSSMNMQMEEFYRLAKDSDYLVYNGSIRGAVRSLSELKSLNPVFSDFKAVKEGNLYYTSKDVYQQSMSIGEQIEDFHAMLLGKNESLKYLRKMEES